MMSRKSSGWSHVVAWTLRGVSLCLVPALAAAAPGTRRTGAGRPAQGRARTGDAAYLLAVGPPPLRYEQALPPPDLSTHPAPAAPPLPAAMAEIAAANVAAARPEPGRAPGPAPAPDEPAPPAGPAPAKPPTEKEAGPLIPDDARHEVRLEEILPYFQFPAAGRPAPSGSGDSEATRLPVSSAVYRQQ